MRSKKLSHLTNSGQAQMVDISPKSPTRRSATAEGYILMAPATLKALRDNSGPKGEVLPVARIAAIQAAKRTADLIPLCHPLPLEHIEVTFELDPPLPSSLHRSVASSLPSLSAVRITATATITAKTGIEMEAYTAVAVAALTILDMLKALDQKMQITGIRLLKKTGGKSDFKL